MSESSYAGWKWFEETVVELARERERNAKLVAALHDAFMAMCAYRDSPDDEVFQDAIDALGLAANQQSTEKT